MNGQIDMFDFLMSFEDKAEVKTSAPLPKKEAPKKAEPKKTEVKKSDTPKKSNVVEFKRPTEKPELEKVKTSGNHTYAECEAKMSAELKKYEGANHEYVINGVLELCKVDKDTCNNLMRPEKTYEGCLKYMFECASKGYCFRSGNVGTMTDDMALGLAIDYYNGK